MLALPLTERIHSVAVDLAVLGCPSAIPYEIFQPDRDGIQPDSGGNTVLGVKHQPDMNLTKRMSCSVLESRASVWLVSCRSLAGQDTNTSATRAENIMHGLAA